MKKIFLLMTVALLALLTACSDNKTTTNNSFSDKAKDKLTVYTTVYPLSYFTERIGRDAVTVSSIYPAGANEHSFEPTQKDMMNLADADLFFYIGLGLEGFVENAEKTLANENVKLIATSNAISDEELKISTGESDDHEAEVVATEEDHNQETEDVTTENHSDHDHGDVDPHVWLSPTISKDLAESIKNELVALLPEQEATFTANYEELIAELDGLDQKFAELTANTETKTFFVSHAAFGYIAGSYGLEQVAIAGLNSQSEPSQKELTEIVDLAKKLDIQTILFEQNVSSKLAETIQNEIGAEALVLNNLSVLTQENIDNKETYFTLMEQNIESLKTALNPQAHQ